MREYNHAWQLSGQLRLDEATRLLKQIIAKDKTFYRAYGALAEVYRQKKELDKAEQYFRSLLGHYPENGEAHYGLGEVYEWKEQWGLAAEQYADCVQKSPQTYPCYSQMVGALAVHRKRAITVRDLQPRPLDNLKSPFRELLLATMYRKPLAPAETAELQLALGLALSRNDDELVARLEYLLAESCGEGKNYSKAVQHFEKSFQLYRQLEDLSLELDVSARLAYSHIRIGNFNGARFDLEGNLSLARKLGHRRYMADGLRAMGWYYNLRGDQQAALRSYHEAKQQLEALNYPTDVLNSLLAIGSIYEEIGELSRARECFAECRATARKVGLKWQEAFALRRLGDTYRDAGEYVKALESLTEAVRMFRENGNSINVPAGLRVIASVHSALGNYSYASDLYERSLSEAGGFSDTEQQERTLQGLGRLYLRMEQPKQALQYLRQALSISDRTGHTALRSATLRDAGDAYRMLGDPESAIARLNEALRIARLLQMKPDEAAALTALGRSHLDKGRLAPSEACFRESLVLAQRLGMPEIILAAREGIAQTCLRRGLHAQAFQHLQPAVETIESLRARIPTPELQAAFVQQNSRVYETIIEVLSRLHARDPAAGYDRQAFDYVERGRARAFLDLLAESKASVTKGLNAEQVRSQHQFQTELSKASAALLREGSESNRRAVESAERRLAEWALAMRRTSPRYHELQYPRPYDAAKAQSILAAAGAVTLEYALGEHQSLLWIVTAKQTRMVPLPGRAEIEQQVASFRAAAARQPKGDFEAWQTPARRLYKILIGPAEASLRGTRNLVIVPDGVLYYLPFEALVSSAEGSARFLIEEHAVAYAPSATVFGNLLAEPEKQARPRSQELLAYGDPTFGSAPAAAGNSRLGDLLRGVYQSAGIQFPPLPNTRAEVEFIGALYSPARRKIYLGSNATEASIKREYLPSYIRLHFATHAVLDEQVPARSGVVLSLVNTGDEDGILRTNEIFNLELNADLVVLSACESGLGTLVKGEGMVGLTRAFLYAGSPRVVVSLWEVNDHATAEFMKIFYQKMKDGQSPGLALRAAKLDMLHSGSAAYRHPYFWTPFVLVGRF
jgi:CHAT domain-containing protein/Tfp pilus assembly protein PilF